MRRVTRIACCQLSPVVGDLAANRSLIAAAIAAADADIVVLPELATSGYMLSAEEAAAVALRPSELGWDGAPVVVGGFCERGEDGRLYNSAAVVVAGEVRAVYRKTHLWDEEPSLFAAGDALPPVVDTPCGRIGVLICYDLEFPEMPRGLALRGADLIACPVNWPLVEVVPDGERPSEQITAMATARANRVFLAVADREGVERGVDWVGGTCLIDERGWVVSGDVDLTRARDKQLTARSDVLADRRPELYGTS
jgi:5-aminopentanamidase